MAASTPPSMISLLAMLLCCPNNPALTLDTLETQCSATRHLILDCGPYRLDSVVCLVQMERWEQSLCCCAIELPDKAPYQTRCAHCMTWKKQEMTYDCNILQQTHFMDWLQCLRARPKWQRREKGKRHRTKGGIGTRAGYDLWFCRLALQHIHCLRGP